MKTLFTSTYTQYSQCYYDFYSFSLSVDGKKTDVQKFLPPDRKPFTDNFQPRKEDYFNIPQGFGFQAEGEWITEEQIWNCFPRFLCFCMRDGFDGHPKEKKHCRIGLYDKKTRRVIVEPSENYIWFFADFSDGAILVLENTGERDEFGIEKSFEYLIDYDGKVLYPWLYDGKFAEVNLPNRHLFTVVGIHKAIEESLPDDAGLDDPYIFANGRYYRKYTLSGVVASSGKVVIPLRYRDLFEIADAVYVCIDEKEVAVIQLEDSDG